MFSGSGRSSNRYPLRAFQPHRLWLALLMVLTLSFGMMIAVPASAQDTSTTSTPASTSGSLSVADVAAKANPAVVTIYTYTSSQSNGLVPVQPGQSGQGNAQDGEQPLGAGSGWIYDSEGHVVTNAHVVEGADSFTVTFQDGTETDATLVGKDTFQDVAVLKLDLSDGQQLPGVAVVGDSSAMRAGDPVVALGTPLGEFANSVSDGIIGGLDRSLDTGLGYRLAHLIQHDADLSSGNSGGPLVNMQGEVIGMNVASISNQSLMGSSAISSGLNFAIDGNTVVSVAKQIITHGDVAHPYLGIQGRETTQGQLVAAVEPGSPAETAGLQVDDLITAVDDQQLSPDLPLMNALFDHQPGDQVTLTVQRNGSTETLSVTLGQRPADA
jgi:2-alkenal reductase